MIAGSSRLVRLVSVANYPRRILKASCGVFLLTLLGRSDILKFIIKTVFMRKIIATEFLSLDGIFEEPGTWSMSYVNDQFFKYKTEELMQTSAFLLGRVTYEGFAKAWPPRKGADDFSNRFNAMPKFVISNTLMHADWENSSVLKNIDEIRKLKEQPGGDILLQGSGMLLNSLLQQGLIDEIKMLVYPVVLGTGRHLFQTVKDLKLKLVECKNFTTGVVALKYEPIKQ